MADVLDDPDRMVAGRARGTGAAPEPGRAPAAAEGLRRIAGLIFGGSELRARIQASSAPDAANRKNMALLVQLRWIAVAGQVATIALAKLWLGVALPLGPMALVVAALIVLNLATYPWLRGRQEVTGRALLLVLILDVAALTTQLWLSGGAANPFISLYLLQITLGAVLLDALSTWVIVALACASVAALTVTYRPLPLPREPLGDILSLHLTGMLACFLLDAFLLVVFVTRVSRNLRDRDAHLAALRQQATEESHIVRIGLLAAGAAHELGTPLASLSVILGDWRHMQAVAADGEMAQELEEMQTAVRRCKAIVTDILLSAGAARGEASGATTLNRFIEAILREWRSLRSTDILVYDNRLPAEDIPIAFDAVVKQAIFNVLDNALEVSPKWVRLTVERNDHRLVMQVSDAGPGFEPGMLPKIGIPYQSTKEGPGRGLGLFLVVNVLRKLGGTIPPTPGS